jgi:hypothetical protein
LAIKLRLVLENNFHFVETLSLLATVRYIFEALVWLRVLRKDERYGLAAYYQLAVTSVHQAKEQKRKMQDEIQFYERLAAEENRMMDEAMKSERTVEKWGDKLRFIADEVDRRSRREFNVYADQAKIKWVCLSSLPAPREGSAPGWEADRNRDERTSRSWETTATERTLTYQATMELEGAGQGRWNGKTIRLPVF